MRKPIVIILSVSLAITLIVLLILFWQHNKTKETVISHERKLSEFDERTIQRNQENKALREKIRENLKQLEGLQKAKKHISELENTTKLLRDEISSSDTTATELREKLDNFRLLLSELNDKIQKKEDEFKSLHSQFSEMKKQKNETNVQIVQLNEKLRIEISQVDDLKEKLSKAQAEIKSLMDQALTLRKQKLKSDAYLEKITAGYDAAITDLNREIENKNYRVFALEKKLKETLSEADILKDKANKGESKIEELEQKISKLFGGTALLESQMDQLKSTHRSMIGELKNQIDKKEVNIKELKDKLSITFVDRILFEFSKSTISPQGKEILTKVGKVLGTLEDKKIRVVGYTDNIPIMEGYRHKYPSNWELSAFRAASVVRFFQKEIGIDPKNLEAVGRSFYDSIASNETKEGRAKNRRVNIIIAPKTE